MCYARDRQKNYVIFDEKMHVSAVEKLELETDLRLAIERDQLELFCQPIMDPENMTLAGFEALVRWNHPKRGLISPDEFVKPSKDTRPVYYSRVSGRQRTSSGRSMTSWQNVLPLAELVVLPNTSELSFIETPQ